MYVKTRLIDALILFKQQANLIASAAVMTYIVSLGFGKHLPELLSSGITLPTLDIMTSVGTAALVLDGVAQTWSKTSFAILLLRVSEGKSRYIIWALIISINIFVGVGCLLFFVRCNPIEKAWTLEMTTGTCWDYEIAVHYGMFSSGMYHLLCLLLSIPLTFQLTIMQPIRGSATWYWLSYHGRSS